MIGHYSQRAHQGISDPSRSMANGGGGGDSTDTRYSNLDKLYGVQSQASQYMLDNAMPYVSELTTNSAQMNQDAQDGTLAKQMSEQAGNNSQAAFGSALDANNRNMQRYGMQFNANRMLSEGNRNAIMGAATKAGEMNKANAQAEDMKWNRNANFYGQVMGMNSGAMSGLSSAGSGMSNTANQQSSYDAKNAAGYGQAGSAFASSLFKKDGGAIDKNAIRMASGGDAWEAYKAANPVKASSSSGGKKTNGLKAMLGGAAPQLLGYGVKDLFKGSDGKIWNAAKGAYDYVSKPGASSMDGVTYGGDTVADLPANAIDGSLYADTASYAGAGYEGASAGYDAVTGAPEGITYGGDLAADGVSAAAPVAAEGVGAAAEAAPSVFESVGSLLNMANGGSVRKQNAYAMGGLAGNTVAKSNQIDGNDTLAKMDASDSMSVAKMGTTSNKNSVGAPETHAKHISSETGRTDGMSESSSNDPDGFGKEGADNRHLAGKATMSVAGYAMGVPGLGIVADAIHPIMEPLTREMIATRPVA